MSSWKYKNREQLVSAKAAFFLTMEKLNYQIDNAETQLHWINHYLAILNKPEKLTVKQIEEKLGFKVHIVSEDGEVLGGKGGE